MKILIVDGLPISFKTYRTDPKYLSDKGYQCTVICPQPKVFDKEFFKGYRNTKFFFCYELKYIGTNSYTLIFNRLMQVFSMIRNIRKILKKDNYDLIRSVGFLPTFCSIIATRSKNNFNQIPIVFTCTDFYSDLYKQFNLPFFSVISGFLKKLECYIAKNANVLIVDTPIQRRHWGKLGFNEKKCVVIPHGYEDSLVQKQHNLSKIRYLYGIGEDTKIVFYCGDISTLDGIDILIKSAPSVLRELNVMFMIVGNGLKKYLDFLKSLARKLNIDKHIIFVGQVSYSDMPSYITSADVCVAPFRLSPTSDTAQCYKVLAYIILKKPAIVTSGKGVQELFGNIINYIPPENPDILATTLIKVLQQGPLSPEIKGKIDILAKRFNWGAIWEQEEKIFQAVVNHIDNFQIFDFFK